MKKSIPLKTLPIPLPPPPLPPLLPPPTTTTTPPPSTTKTLTTTMKFLPTPPIPSPVAPRKPRSPARPARPSPIISCKNWSAASSARSTSASKTEWTWRLLCHSLTRRSRRGTKTDAPNGSVSLKSVSSCWRRRAIITQPCKECSRTILIGTPPPLPPPLPPMAVLLLLPPLLPWPRRPWLPAPRRSRPPLPPPLLRL